MFHTANIAYQFVATHPRPLDLKVKDFGVSLLCPTLSAANGFQRLLVLPLWPDESFSGKKTLGV
jgi:hypothetical protein